jgi:hypothetical protein
MRQPKQASLTLRSVAVVAVLPALPHAGSVLSAAVSVVIGVAVAVCAVGVAYVCYALWRDRPVRTSPRSARPVTRRNDCVHSSTSPSYAVSGSAGTLVVITCNDCGTKVSSTMIRIEGNDQQ